VQDSAAQGDGSEDYMTLLPWRVARKAQGRAVVPHSFQDHIASAKPNASSGRNISQCSWHFDTPVSLMSFFLGEWLISRYSLSKWSSDNYI